MNPGLATESYLHITVLTYPNIEKDGLQPEIIDGIGGGDEELLMDVEAVENVDGATMLG